VVAAALPVIFLVSSDASVLKALEGDLARRFGSDSQIIAAVGASAGFAPLVADTSLWFVRRRGIAVAICASGNYLAGAVWPPVLQHYVDTIGWRAAFTGIGIFCAATMIPLAFALRRKPPELDSSAHSSPASNKTLDIAPNTLLALLCIAGVACCVAMSMP